MDKILLTISLFTLSILLQPQQTNASPIGKCFENEKNAAHIAVCAGEAYLAMEVVRIDMETEAIRHAKEVDTSTEYKRILKDRLSENKELEDKLSRQKNDPVFTVKNGSEPNVDQEHLDEYQNIARTNTTRELFEEYRDAECTRQAMFLKGTPQDKLITEKICLYNMTKQRIKGLESGLDLQ